MIRRRLPQLGLVLQIAVLLLFSGTCEAAAVLGLGTRRSFPSVQQWALHNDASDRRIALGATRQRPPRPRHRRRIRDISLLFLASSSNQDVVSGDESILSGMQADPSVLGEKKKSISYESLSPIARLVAGAVEGVVTVAIEYVSGFPLAYLAGTVVGLPGFFRGGSSVGWGVVHAKSMRWGHSMGTLNAVFGGSAVLVKTIRPQSRNQHGAHDPWNQILSSMLAGAYFARKEGPQAMVRSAVMYGGLLYLVSGRERKTDPSGYEDQVLGL